MRWVTPRTAPGRGPPGGSAPCASGRSVGLPVPSCASLGKHVPGKGGREEEAGCRPRPGQGRLETFSVPALWCGEGSRLGWAEPPCLWWARSHRVGLQGWGDAGLAAAGKAWDPAPNRGEEGCAPLGPPASPCAGRRRRRGRKCRALTSRFHGAMGGRAQSCAGASCCGLQPWLPVAGQPRPRWVSHASRVSPARPDGRAVPIDAPAMLFYQFSPSAIRGKLGARLCFWLPSLGAAGGSGPHGAVAGWEVGVSVLGWGHPSCSLWPCWPHG